MEGLNLFALNGYIYSVSRFRTIFFWTFVMAAFGAGVYAYFNLKNSKKPKLNAVSVFPDAGPVGVRYFPPAVVFSFGVFSGDASSGEGFWF